MQGKNPKEFASDGKNAPALVNDFLGAAHAFAAAVQTVLEEDLLRDASFYEGYAVKLHYFIPSRIGSVKNTRAGRSRPADGSCNASLTFFVRFHSLSRILRCARLLRSEST